VRTDQQFDDAHIAGALCIPMLVAGFGSKLAWLADREHEIVFVGRAEWAAGHIPGSTFAPWHDIAEVPEGLEASLPIAVLCASGQRAAIAASLVQRFGGRHVVHVVGGGVPKLGRLGHPLERSGAPAPCSS